MDSSGNSPSPSTLGEGGRGTSSGGGEFDLSTYFNSHHLHIPSKQLMFFIHLKPEVEAIGVGGGDRGGISPPFSLPGGREGGGVLSR